MTNKKDERFEATVEELLGEETSAELERRDGEWNAFTSAVFRRIDEEDLGLQRLPLEDQAIEMFRQDIDGELSELAPKFEEGFREGIEQRIWDAAREEPTFGQRARAFFDRLMGDGMGWSLGWAGAMAAVLFMVAVGGWPTVDTPDQIAENISGGVTVQDLSFEGNVTVMPGDGATVIFLSNDESS